MKSVAVVELSVVVGEGSIDISKTSAAAVVELVVLGVGSAAMAMGPVVKGDGSVAVEVCITSDTTVVDSVAEVEGSAAVVDCCWINNCCWGYRAQCSRIEENL